MKTFPCGTAVPAKRNEPVLIFADIMQQEGVYKAKGFEEYRFLVVGASGRTVLLTYKNGELDTPYGSWGGGVAFYRCEGAVVCMEIKEP